MLFYVASDAGSKIGVIGRLKFSPLSQPDDCPRNLTKGRS
jgi:hypothetical protein